MPELQPDPAPASKFATPALVAKDPTLSLDEKRRLLEEWEDDIRATLVASEEGMTGPEKVTLNDVLLAKESLPIDTPARPSDAKA